MKDPETEHYTLGWPGKQLVLRDVTVPAGTFNAFIVSWAKTIIDAAGAETTETAVLHWAPDIGIVRHETFDGVTLDLQVAP